MREPVVFEGVHCRIEIRRPAHRLVVLQIEGSDVGELGDAPLLELAADLAREPFAFFVDARAVRGASMDVSHQWAAWMREHKDKLERVVMLPGSRFIQLTADFVRKFAELGERMHVSTDRTAFEDALAAEIAARSEVVRK